MKQLPEALSIDEAIAFMINLPYKPDEYSIEDLLQGFRDDAANKCLELENLLEKNLYHHLMQVQELRISLSKHLREILEIEKKLTQEKYDRDIKFDRNSFVTEKIITPNFIMWAQNFGFGIVGNQINPYWRKIGYDGYSTPYLDLIDEVIHKFYEEDGSEYNNDADPKNEEIIKFLKNKISKISPKMTEAICTILKPDLTFSKIKVKDKPIEKTPEEKASEDVFNFFHKKPN